MFGEVYICHFPFTSGLASKIRPALVLFDLAADSIICRVTSVMYSGPMDVVLKNQQKAGLLKPSTVRLNRLVTVDRSVFVRRLGLLSAGDLETIRATWNKQMKL
jgi:mRNA interferase MazF